jgi:hypothetical protein
VFGEFRTFHVAVSHVEAEAGLDFGVFKDADPLYQIESIDAVRQ